MSSSESADFFNMSLYLTKAKKPLCMLLLLLSCLLTTPIGEVQAETPRSYSKLVYYPIGDQSEKSLHLVFPTEFRNTANGLRSKIQDDYQALSNTFGSERSFSAQVQLMEAERFYQKMNVPRWTNAIYIRSKIFVPIKHERENRSGELQRALRHELVHAIIDHQSKGRCPGWLDEGLAQLLEGPEHPILRSALQKWVSRNGVIPLSTLKNGFTKLPREMVPAAYAQSLYATKLLLQDKERSTLKVLMHNLRKESYFPRAFQRSFNMTIEEFQAELEEKLEVLAQSKDYGQSNPVWNVAYEKFQLETAAGTGDSVQAGKASIDLTK
ncbi:MAG: hypothetical protein KDD70_09745 [Bdellovibrionales bacterium]|nr:hypothetical protein [Bdellovibrionales bacterium]